MFPISTPMPSKNVITYYYLHRIIPQEFCNSKFGRGGMQVAVAKMEAFW
jgi:hypothetical protein